MKGADAQEYDVEVTDVNQVIPIPWLKEGTVRIAFKLREAGASSNANEELALLTRQAQLADLTAQLAEAQAELTQARTNLQPTHPEVQRLQQGIAGLQKQIQKLKSQPRKLIDSQFDMAIGETVVVGTSRIGGDKGLVVLLTAVAAGGK
jgi:septal ring factor EnvC (AmiA/AmiB activator)